MKPFMLGKIPFPLEATPTFVAFVGRSIQTFFLFEMHNQMPTQFPGPIPNFVAFRTWKFIFGLWLFLGRQPFMFVDNIYLTVGNFRKVTSFLHEAVINCILRSIRKVTSCCLILTVF